MRTAAGNCLWRTGPDLVGNRSLVREGLATEITLLDLGEHVMKDLEQPEHIRQLSHPELRAELLALTSVAPAQHGLEFGKVLREYRLAAALTQEELAERAGMSVRGLSDLERGARRAPFPNTLQRLTDALKLDARARAQLAAAARGASDAVAAPALARRLPVALTSFVGRERERGEIKQLLASCRLVTLTGFGGVGKTRLAVQVASELAAEYGDSRYVVELASLRDPALVPRAVASVLGIHEQPGVPLVAIIAEVIDDRRVLVVIDNCEHVVSAVAQLASALLRDCAQLRILATSREVIGIDPEVAWSVPPLSLPELQGQASVAQLRKAEAVLLFVDRCRSVQPGFALIPHNACAVAEVCRRVEGIPLALELAAARLRVLSVEQLVDRLADQLGLLISPNRLIEPRQQTLRATIEWSYTLLSERERLLFDRLSVFAGGFSIEAVGAVCTGDGVETRETLNLLQSLVEKSLVLADLAADGSITRLRQLESLRQYGHERLVEARAVERFSARHAAFFAGVVEELGARFHGPDQRVVLKQLEAEHDNIRVALRWLVDKNDAGTALRFADMGWFWSLRGHWAEARAWLDSVLAIPCGSEYVGARATMSLLAAQAAWLEGDMPSAIRLGETSLALARQANDRRTEGLAIGFAGLMLWIQEKQAAALPLLKQSLALARTVGDGWNETRQLELLGMAALRDGDLATARDRIEESVAAARHAGDAESLSIALNFLGDVAAIQGASNVAEAAYRESLELSDALGAVPSAITSLFCLGFLAVGKGDLTQAASVLRESLHRLRRRGGKRGVAECLIGFAGIARAQGDDRVATRLLGAAEATLESIGARMWTSYQPYFDREVSAVRARLDVFEFDAEWRAGRALLLNQAIAMASLADSST